MDTKMLRDTLHTLLCDLPHENKMEKLLGERDPCKCYYYLESSMSNADEHPDHTYWEGQAQKIMLLVNTTDPSVALSAIYRALTVIEKITNLSPVDRSLFELFYKLQLTDESDLNCEI